MTSRPRYLTGQFGDGAHTVRMGADGDGTGVLVVDRVNSDTVTVNANPDQLRMLRGWVDELVGRDRHDEPVSAREYDALVRWFMSLAGLEAINWYEAHFHGDEDRPGRCVMVELHPNGSQKYAPIRFEPESRIGQLATFIDSNRAGRAV